MQVLKLIIVDDEENVREALTQMLNKFTTGFEIVGVYDNLGTAVEAIAVHKPDIVLLDIELGKDNAFNIYNHYPRPAFKVIFITSYQQYAVQAFRFSAMDYLLKPVDPDLLITSLARAREDIDKDAISDKIDCLLANLSTTKSLKKIVLKTEDNIHIVNLEDIMYCEAINSYTAFYCADKTKITVSNTLGEYEDMFNEFGFIRIHRSYLLNINYIKRYEKTDGGLVILKDNTNLPLSTRKKERFLEILKRL